MERQNGNPRSLGILAMAGLILLSGAALADRQPVRLSVGVGSRVLPADAPGRVVLKIALDGEPLEQTARRPPVNLALVLDRSGSMSGEKLFKAKEAALYAIDRLGADDILSVVTYSHNVEVLVPATKVRDREALRQAIRSIESGGDTALFSGVSVGAAETRKFLDAERVNRIILLSDGLANVGPSSPEELGQLGWALGKEGISVTTIGLGDGYNEDLMVELARLSDGNHGFAENARDLARLFTAELGDVLSVVAREIVIELTCPRGVRPIRVLGREAEISGQRVLARLNQVYAKQEKFLLVEVEVEGGADGESREVGQVAVRYRNPTTRSQERAEAVARIAFSRSAERVRSGVDPAVTVDVVAQVANDNNREALRLRDEGRHAAAKDKLRSNAAMLREAARDYQAPKLGQAAAANDEDAEAVDSPAPAWNVKRKAMRKRQYEFDQQQAW